MSLNAGKKQPVSYPHPPQPKKPESSHSRIMTAMLLTRKIRIAPTRAQTKVMWALSEKCRLLYNFALAERRFKYVNIRKQPTRTHSLVTYLQQQNALPALKVRYPEYTWVYSKVLQMVLRRLDADYKSFFAQWRRGDPKARPPRFKGKDYFTTLCYNQSGFTLDIEQKRIRFAHRHPSGVNLEFLLSWLPPLTGKIRQVDLFQDRRRRWFVAITYEKAVPPYVDNGQYQAMDLGVINLVTAVNLKGRFVQMRNRRPDLYWKDKLRQVQSRRDHCRMQSNRWWFYHRKWQKMRRKLTNQLRDFQHKVSKVVVTHTRANTLIVGDLAVKRMARKKRNSGCRQQDAANRTLNHSLQNTGFLGRFVQFLTYKAKKVGKSVIRIDEAQTTKRCCVCGKVRVRRLSERIIQCDCGTPFNRDQNAAVNIMVRFLLQQPPVNGEPLQTFLDGLHRHTALPHSPRGVDSMEIPAAV
ncbi:MAG: RNA-guided endonuclease InsQ/TnpB family protein [Candidatus Hermodarchaeota archaeon]